MVKIIGQTYLIDKLKRYDLSFFPNTILLLGEKGSGRHLICSMLSDYFKLPLVDISEIIDDDVINNIYLNPNPSFYLIDLSLCDARKQNLMLKFLEEPNKNTFIILISETKNNLLDTIINRTVIFNMDKYSDEELMNFTSDSDLIKIIRTPGKLLTCRENIGEMYSLCDTIYKNLEIANFANTLTLTDRFNYKDDFDKFDINIFLDVLLNRLFEGYVKDNNKQALTMYLLVDDEKKKLSDLRINKKIFIQHLLIKLWKSVRKDEQ